MASTNDEMFLSEMNTIMQQLVILWNSKTYFVGIHMQSKETGEVFPDVCVHTFKEAFGRLKIIYKSSQHNYWVGPAEGADGGRNQEIWKHITSVIEYLMMDEEQNNDNDNHNNDK